MRNCADYQIVYAMFLNSALTNCRYRYGNRIRPAKDAGNIKKHGISLSRAIDFEMLVFLEDDRFDYGETRYRAWGLIDGEAYCLAFTDRGGVIRAISLRRAHQKEMDRYVPKA